MEKKTPNNTSSHFLFLRVKVVAAVNNLYVAFMYTPTPMSMKEPHTIMKLKNSGVTMSQYSYSGRM